MKQYLQGFQEMLASIASSFAKKIQNRYIKAIMDAKNEMILLQVRLFRLAMESWKKNQQEVASLFRKNGVYKFISDMYEEFHVQGDEANLREIEAFLKGKEAL